MITARRSPDEGFEGDGGEVIQLRFGTDMIKVSTISTAVPFPDTDYVMQLRGLFRWVPHQLSPALR